MLDSICRNGCETSRRFAILWSTASPSLTKYLRWSILTNCSQTRTCTSLTGVPRKQKLGVRRRAEHERQEACQESFMSVRCSGRLGNFEKLKAEHSYPPLMLARCGPFASSENHEAPNNNQKTTPWIESSLTDVRFKINLESTSNSIRNRFLS